MTDKKETYFYISYVANTPNGYPVNGYVIHRTRLSMFTLKNVIQQLKEAEELDKIILTGWQKLTKEEFTIFDGD